MTFRDRQRVMDMLINLGLVVPWSPRFNLNLLHSCSPAISLFWTEDALIGVAQAITHYWETEKPQEARERELLERKGPKEKKTPKKARAIA